MIERIDFSSDEDFRNAQDYEREEFEREQAKEIEYSRTINQHREEGNVSFTDGKPFVVTEEDTHKAWSGGANGKYFRCYLCGYKFKPGDIARWQFTNNIKDAGGNPMVCIVCDSPNVIEKWKQMKLDMKTKYWWVNK